MMRDVCLCMYAYVSVCFFNIVDSFGKVHNCLLLHYRLAYLNPVQQLGTINKISRLQMAAMLCAQCVRNGVLSHV